MLMMWVYILFSPFFQKVIDALDKKDLSEEGHLYVLETR